MSACFEATRWLRHQFMARGPHGVHSPLVYRMITEVLTRRREARNSLKPVEACRQRYLADRGMMRLEDFGAGSRRRGTSRSISSIARHASSSAHQLEALWCLVRDARPDLILEFGTNLGLGTITMALAAPEARIITMEGDPQLSSMARQQARDLGLDQIEFLSGSFDALLPVLAGRDISPDFTFLDGNHRRGPVLEYSQWLLSRCRGDATILIDDVYWSRDMSAAWSELCSRSDVPLTMDFFHFGLIRTGARLRKEHFVLRLP